MMMTSSRMQEIERMAEAGNPFAREFIDGLKEFLREEHEKDLALLRESIWDPNDALNDLQLLRFQEGGIPRYVLSTLPEPKP